MRLLTKLFLTIDFIIISLLVVIYVPTFEFLQRRFVNEIAIENKKNYLSYVFYDEEKVEDLTNENIFISSFEESNYGDIDKNAKKITYDNIYDQLVLTRDPGNDNYKVIKTLIGGYPAYIVVIYHPEDVVLLKSRAFNTADHYSGLSTVKQMTDAVGAVVGINGGGFKNDARTYGIDTPTGYIIKDGEIIWNRTDKGKGRIIGIDNNNRLRLVHVTGQEALDMGIRDAMEFGPFLIVDGVKQKLGLYAGGFQRTARTVIAQRDDGIMLFVVTDNYGSFYQGPNMNELADKLLLYGVTNAANLDGGGSSQLIIDGKLYNYPLSIYNEPVNRGRGRSVVNGWGLVVGSGSKKD